MAIGSTSLFYCTKSKQKQTDKLNCASSDQVNHGQANYILILIYFDNPEYVSAVRKWQLIKLINKICRSLVLMVRKSQRQGGGECNWEKNYNYHKNYPRILWGNFFKSFITLTILYLEEYQTKQDNNCHKISSHVTSKVLTSSVTWLFPSEVFLLLWQDFINDLKTNSIFEVSVVWGI